MKNEWLHVLKLHGYNELMIIHSHRYRFSAIGTELLPGHEHNKTVSHPPDHQNNKTIGYFAGHEYSATTGHLPGSGCTDACQQVQIFTAVSIHADHTWMSKLMFYIKNGMQINKISYCKLVFNFLGVCKLLFILIVVNLICMLNSRINKLY